MQGFSTVDLDLTTALVTHLGLSFPSVKTNGRLAAFVFDLPEERIRPAVDSYFNRTLQVDARTFAENRRSLVTAMHQARGSRLA